jgi:hypothetical protein
MKHGRRTIESQRNKAAVIGQDEVAEEGYGIRV